MMRRRGSLGGRIYEEPRRHREHGEARIKIKHRGARRITQSFTEEEIAYDGLYFEPA
jgi:hypothetical protein